MDNGIIELEDGITIRTIRGKLDSENPQPIAKFTGIYYEIHNGERIFKRYEGGVQLLPENANEVVGVYYTSVEWMHIEDSERHKMKDFLIANGFNA